MQLSKCLNYSSFFILPSLIFVGGYSLLVLCYVLLFNPKAAALEDLGLGVVATRCALANSISSLNYSKSEKLSNKSIIYSSI